MTGGYHGKPLASNKTRFPALLTPSIAPGACLSPEHAATRQALCGAEGQVRTGKRLCISSTSSAGIDSVARGTKLAVVEQLLSRLDEKVVREQVTASLLNSNLAELERHTSSAQPSPAQDDDYAERNHRNQRNGSQHDTSDDESYKLVSPLDMMTAAVTASKSSWSQTQDARMVSPLYEQSRQTSSLGLIDERLINYFCA